MLSFPFQEPLTAGLRLYPHNDISNCQQEAILKSQLSKILRTYSSEGNTLPESRERSLARTFKIHEAWWGPPIPKGTASCHQVKDSGSCSVSYLLTPNSPLTISQAPVSHAWEKSSQQNNMTSRCLKTVES